MQFVAQVPRESSLLTNTTHGDRAVEGAYMGADASTDSIHVQVFKTKSVQLFSDWKAFPNPWPFQDPSVLKTDTDFDVTHVKHMHNEDDAESLQLVS